MSIQYLPETLKKAGYVRMRGIVVKNFIIQTLELVVVHNKQDTEGTIIQFVSGDITGKVRQDIVKIFALDGAFNFFSPSTRPSFESYPTEQKPDGLAINARMPIGTASRPPPPVALSETPPDWYIDSWALPNRPCLH